MTAPQEATALEHSSLDCALPASEVSEDIVPGPLSGALLAGLPRDLAAGVVAALITCSSALGAADPWAHRDVTDSVALQAEAPAQMRRISLVEACRIADEFNRRLDEAYARSARAEAEAAALWEEEL
ncbi:hypothetical protein ACFL09_04520 [Planctomycetota bacterium]